MRQFNHKYRWIRGIASGWFWFGIATLTLCSRAQNSSDFTVLVYGDSRKGTTIHQDLVALMQRQPFALILHSGDLVTSGYSQMEWNQTLQIIDPLNDSTLSPPVFLAAPGNHDVIWNTTNYTNWHHYLPWLPGNGEFYKFDYRNLRIIVLDSNPDRPLAPQTDSLRAWLSDNPQAWTILCWHHPTFPFDGARLKDGQLQEWWALIYQYGADLVINGHEHYYARSYPIHPLQTEPYGLRDDRGGVIQLITGGGGAPLHSLKKNKKNQIYFKTLLAKTEKVHHFCRLDVSDTQLQVTAVGRDGKVIDRFVIAKK